MRRYRSRYRPGDPVLDRFDNELKVGDFIQYVLFHAGGGAGAGIFYGYITKIGRTGKVEAKNIKLSPHCYIEEKTIKDNACIIKMPPGVEKAWKDHLVMAKLAAD
jgi:hypothetical protein